MSGFERSAPIPGSQGPRRSQMKRLNNAPPPESEWRLEVLRAKKEAEAQMRGNDRRGGSRSPSPAGREKRKEGKEKVAEFPTEKTQLLRKISQDRGEGWYAAVSHAADRWESVDYKKLQNQEKNSQTQKAASSRVGEETSRGAKREREREKQRQLAEEEAREEAREQEAKRRQKEDKNREEELRKREDQRREQERLERLRQEEYEARERRNAEARKKAEDERKHKEEQEKQRRKKLKSAFAMDSDDDEVDEAKRDASLLRKIPARVPPMLASGIATPSGTASTISISTVASRQSSFSAEQALTPSGEELGPKLGFNETGLDPAMAFMKLQERKRKGRRPEFGGPPRGCSPWRDGKRGVMTPLAEQRRSQEGG